MFAALHPLSTTSHFKKKTAQGMHNKPSYTDHSLFILLKSKIMSISMSKSLRWIPNKNA